METIPAPIGQDLTIETMRVLAQKYNARHFVEEMPTDASHNGFLLNPDEARRQFGVATYEIGQGITLTHSIASYVSADVATQYAVTSSPETPVPIIYNDVIDISLPYSIPHMIIYPRFSQGFWATLFSSDAPLYPKHVATRVRLEGDFSEFVDVYTPVGESVDAFVYLVPNIMELVLEKATDVTVEFIGTHIYIYYRPPKAVATTPGHTTYITGTMHESVLKTALAIGDRLVRASRPAQEAPESLVRMPSPARYLWHALRGLFYVVIGTFVLPSALFAIGFVLNALGIHWGSALFFALLAIPFVPVGYYLVRSHKNNRRVSNFARKYKTPHS